MNLYKTYKASDDMEKQGIDLQYGADCKIRIARAGGSNSRFVKLLGDKLKPYRRQIDNGTMDDKVAEKIMAEVYADTVILGWSGVDDADGNRLEFNRENCVLATTALVSCFVRYSKRSAFRIATNFSSPSILCDVGGAALFAAFTGAFAGLFLIGFFVVFFVFICFDF